MKIKHVIKNGKPRWRVDFRLSGRRQRVFFKTEKEALDYSKTIAEEKKEHGEQAHSITYQERAQFHSAMEILKPTGATMIEAARFYVDNCKSRSEKALNDALEECIKAKTIAGVRQAYAKNLKNTLKRFIGERGSETCSHVTREQIESWLAKSENAHTRKGQLADVQTFFAFCLKRGWVAKNPCADIERVLIDPAAPCIFTPAEAHTWMTAISEHDPLLIPYFTLCMFAGIRPEEARRLSIEHICVDRGFVNIPAEIAKGRRRRIVHLEPNAVAWLAGLKELPRIHQRDRIADVRKKAPALRWGHDIMRHSFASYHLALHESADKTALEMGNSPQVLFERYREVVTKDAAKEFFAIRPKIGGGSPVNSG